MAPQFTKAVKSQARLRMAIDGPSGSGKTYTALIAATSLASGGNGRIAFIDTERGSASKYADLFDFDVLELDNFHPNGYIAALHAAEEAGYPVVVIDSMSHAWVGEGGVLDLHNAATKRGGGNSFTAWKDVSPLDRKLIDSICQSPSHVIVTMRSKMEYVQVSEGGRTVIKKVGMAPVQRQGVEYEFDIVIDMTIDHEMIVSKTRHAGIADVVMSKPPIEWFTKNVAGWLNSGVAPAPRPVLSAPPPAQQQAHEQGVEQTPEVQTVLAEINALARTCFKEKAAYEAYLKELNMPVFSKCGVPELTYLKNKLTRYGRERGLIADVPAITTEPTGEVAAQTSRDGE